MTFNLFILVYILGTGIAALLAVHSWKRRSETTHFWFSLLCIAIGIWCFTSIGEALSTSISGKYTWGVLSYTGSQTSPVLFFLFVVAFTRFSHYFTRNTRIILFILPIISIILAATNQYHHLLWPDVYLIQGPFSSLSAYYVHGPWYWVEILYSYFFLAAGMLLLFITSLHQPPIYSLQTRFILAASIFPVAGNAFYALFPTFLSGIDITPALFTITCILIYYAITKLGLFDLIPIMCDEIVQSMGEGILVLDQKKRIIRINPAALRIFSLSDTVIGTSVSSVIPEFPDNGVPAMDIGTHQEILLQNSTILSINSYPVLGRDKRILGTLHILSDVTGQVTLENDLRTHSENLEAVSRQLLIANEKLHLLSGITRHDILNELTVLKGYLDIMNWEREKILHPEYLEKAMHAADTIGDLIRFTKTYDTIGTGSISWLNLHALVDAGIMRSFRGEVTIDVTIDNTIPDTCFISTESLLETVFGNLVDNALRHGGRVTRITFSLLEGDETYRVICEDNGAGIDNDEKRKIFRPGYGKNTGYGLFLTKEILAVSEILISEEGVYGEGAAFVLHIPKKLVKFMESTGTEIKA
ncbi:MAG: PAS domain-containing protein [Methanospirillaceae archaeon]|nr:PAS domain-containing protein [Methanospirillaceae archaeon]